MPAPDDEPSGSPSDATRWDDVAPEVPTRGETTRLDGALPVAPPTAGQTAADPVTHDLGVTRWEGGEAAPSPFEVPADLGSTRWETTRADRPAAAPAPAPAPTGPELGQTRWEEGGAPGRGPTMRFDAVLPPPSATPRPNAETDRWPGVLPLPCEAGADVTRMSLEGGAALSAAPAPPQPGPTGAGPFELLGELGRGGMGVVHRARERATGREVALKVVLVDLGTARERLVREGEVTASLQHPNILRVHGAGLLDGRPYLAYELVEGCRDFDDATRGLPLTERVELLRDAARALGYAHARGIIHRDVKPPNLLVDASGRVRVSDFGLAAGVGLERLTLTGAQVGTPAYMAPEQVEARREEVGPWTDVWALGVVLYATLTGQRPFDGGSFTQLCARILEREPAPPRILAPGVAPALEAVCLKALAKRPGDRYPDGEAMARDLERALAGEPVEARPPRRRRPWRWLGLVALVAALAAGVVATRLRAEHVAVAAKADAARAALAAARRARGTRIDDLLASAAAHREAELALGALPPVTAAALAAEHPELAERRAEVLSRLVPALLTDGRADEAVVHARELARLVPSAASRRWLLRALAAAPPLRPEALALARELLREGETEARRAAGEALLDLHRPDDVVAALESTEAPELRLLAARAALRARWHGLALALARATTGDAVERAALAARALIALDRVDEALAAVEASRAEGGARWEWLAARAAVDAARDRPGEARAGFALALAAAERAAPAAVEAVRAERGRHHLRRGRPDQALADLERVRDPGARLDAALARWSLGGADDELAAAIDAARAAVDAFEAPPHLAAAAARWRAWQTVCGGAGADEVARALAALAPDDPLRAWADVHLTWRERGAPAALERLEGLGAPAATDPDLRALRARLLAAIPARRDAALEALADLPPGSPAQADVTRRLLVAAPEADGGAPERARAGLAEQAEGRLTDDMSSREAGERSRRTHHTDVARADRQAARARVVPRPTSRPLPVASEDAPGAEALASSLYRRARLLMPAAERDEAARARCARLLARVVALDPDHALAHAERARFARDLEAADRAVTRWPLLPEVRYARVLLRIDIEAEHESMYDDCVALLDTDVEDVDVAGLVASVRATRGDLDGAWAILEPRLDATEVRLIDLAVRVARGRGDEAGRARAAERLERIASATARRRSIENESWTEGQVAGLDRRWTDLPRDGRYWGFRSALAMHVSQQLESLLSFGRYLLQDLPHPPRPRKLLLAAHSHGFNPLQRQERVVSDLRGAVEAAPDDPAAYLGRAGYLASAFHKMQADDPALPPRGELADAAADEALAGAALAPRRAGPLLLAAWCLIDAGDLAEARALLDLAAAAYGDVDLVCFLRARVAGSIGDAAEAARWLGAMEQDPRNTDSLYRFEDDPSFARVLGRPGFAIPAW